MSNIKTKIRDTICDIMGISDSMSKATGWVGRLKLIEKGYDGEVLRVSHLKNATILGGRTGILEKMFNVSPTQEQHIFLNDRGIFPSITADVNAYPIVNMTFPHSESCSTDTATGLANYNKRKVNCFMVGIGASSYGESTVVPPYNSDTMLYNSIPFRYVLESEDILASERAKYRLRCLVTDRRNGLRYIAYFAKILDLGNLNMTKDIETYIPDPTHTEALVDGRILVGSTISTFLKFNMNIDENECKEYFGVGANNSLVNARVNEFGLIMGLDAPNTILTHAPSGLSSYDEITGVEMVSKICNTNRPLDNLTASYIAEYILNT